MKCEKCLYFYETNENIIAMNNGECRRLPPEKKYIIKKLLRVSIYKIVGRDYTYVQEDDWCGEFKRREK